MNVFKGYLIPKQRKENINKKVIVVPPMKLAVTPPRGSSILTPMRSAFSNPPSSIFPAGDFRNGDSGSILDIKTDVVVNWLHQQQMKKLWSSEFPGEGVVLKKARESFVCSLENLRHESSGFYDNVAAMNVRVSFDFRLRFHIADSHRIVRHDYPDTNDEDFSSKTKCQLCPSNEWAPAPEAPFN